MFEYKQTYIIKMIEKSLGVSNTTERIMLLSNKVIEELKQKINIYI